MWEENWDVLSLYRDNHDQWRMGPAGPYALDMNVFHAELNDLGIQGEKRQEWKRKLRTISKAAYRELKQ